MSIRCPLYPRKRGSRSARLNDSRQSRSTVLTQAASIARLCGRALSAPRRGRYHDSRRGRHGPIGFYFSGHPPAPPTPEGKQRSGCPCPAAAGRPLGAGRAFLCTPACTPAPDWASSALFRTYVKLLISLVAGARFAHSRHPNETGDQPLGFVFILPRVKAR